MCTMITKQLEEGMRPSPDVLGDILLKNLRGQPFFFETPVRPKKKPPRHRTRGLGTGQGGL